RWLPDYIQVQPNKIKKTLLYRFIIASILCFWLDYQLFAIFVCIYRFKVQQPIVSLNEIYQLTFYSVYTGLMMLTMRWGVAGYGLILCKIHNTDPILYQNRMERWARELPLRFQLLASILTISILSSWLYASFVDTLYEDKFLGGSWCFLLTYGIFCGIFYFHKDHGMSLQRFPDPIVHLSLHESLLDMWWPTLKESGKEALISTIIYSLLYWPWMGYLVSPDIPGVCLGLQFVITEPELFFRAWLLSTLILAKLHLVRRLYGLIMQRQLPLIVASPRLHEKQDICLYNLIKGHFQQWLCRMRMKPLPLDIDLKSLSLPYTLALDVSKVYGFRMLAARDFYAAMSGDFCLEFYDLNNLANIGNSWALLRDFTFEKVDEFLARMESCMRADPREKICNLLKQNQGRKIRPSLRSMVVKTIKKSPPKCSTCRALLYKDQPEEYDWIFIIKQYVKDFIRNMLERLPGISTAHRYLFQEDPLNVLNYELESAEHIAWILQGLICVCLRSLKEDLYGIIQRDIPRIFETLLKIEEQLIRAKAVQQRKRGTLCGSHELMMLAVKRCLYKMLVTFAPHFDFMMEQSLLQKTLEYRMENL
ncbi:hypothetical protein KR009_009047, partial [Drosophila setifemur]